ncbi:MAG: histidine kinase, partial [Bacteroidota bacterium]
MEPAINDVEINYRGFAYANVEGLSYEYRLLGFDTDWQFTTLPTARFTNLPPGKYTFEVRARSIDYGRSAEPARLTFEMKAKVVETLTFKILFAILILGFLLLIGGMIIKAINRRVLLLRQLSESRYEALSTQMSPHFIFNAMNSILYLINTDDRKTAHRYLTSFAKLLRSILVDAKETFVPLVDEMWRSQEYLDLEQLQFAGRLRFQIEGDELSDSLLTPQMLIQPFLENAVHHGIRPRGHGEIKLTLKDRGDKIQILIIDDGIGIEAARKHQEGNTSRLKGTGIGIANTQERLKSIRQIYGIETELRILDRQIVEGVSGTIVEVILPKFQEIPKVH